MSFTAGTGFSGSAANTNGNTVGVTSADIGAVAEGDMVVVYLYARNNAVVWDTNPQGETGWTAEIDDQHSTTNGTLAVRWKVAGASEPSTYNWRNDTAATFDMDMIGFPIVEATATSINVDTGQSVSTEDANFDATSTTGALTPTGTGAERFLVVGYGRAQINTVSIGPTNGEFSDSGEGVISGGTTSLVVYYEFGPTESSQDHELTWSGNGQDIGAAITGHYIAAGALPAGEVETVYRFAVG